MKNEKKARRSKTPVPKPAASKVAAGVGKKGKNKPKPARREVLALRPHRNPALEWWEEEGQVVLEIKRARNWKTRLLNLFVPLPTDKRIVLDAIGGDVWRMMDGQTDVGQIANTLARKYQLTPREAELSLQQFFKELGRRGYVAFMKSN